MQCSVENVCLDVFLPSSKWYLKTDKTGFFNLIHTGLQWNTALGNLDSHASCEHHPYSYFVVLSYYEDFSNINYSADFSRDLLLIPIFFNLDCCCALQKPTNAFILVKLKIFELLWFQRVYVCSLGHHLYSTTVSVEGNSLASVEKLKARLLQTQSELASSKQEYEEFKELTKWDKTA